MSDKPVDPKTQAVLTAKNPDLDPLAQAASSSPRTRKAARQFESALSVSP